MEQPGPQEAETSKDAENVTKPYEKNQVSSSFPLAAPQSRTHFPAASCFSSSGSKLQAALPVIRTSQQQRHSVLDLSACDAPIPDGGTVPAIAGVDKAHTRRIVASKRRPSASERQFKAVSATHAFSTVKDDQVSVCSGVLETAFWNSSMSTNQWDESCDTSAIPAEAFSSGPGSLPSAIVESSADDSAKFLNSAGPSPPLVSRIILKEFQKRECAVYEPVVTYKALSSITPLFYRCVGYLMEHTDELAQMAALEPFLLSGFSASQPRDDHSSLESRPSQESTEPLPSTVTDVSGKPSILSDAMLLDSPCGSEDGAGPNVASCLNNVIQQFRWTLRALDKNDTALLKLVYEIEREHTRLYEFQLQWSREHGALSTSTEDKQVACGSEASDIADVYRIPAWPSEALQRLETLERARSKIDQLRHRGITLCKNLDAVIRDALSLTLRIMERGSRDFPIERSMVMDSSLCPLTPSHPVTPNPKCTASMDATVS